MKGTMSNLAAKMLNNKQSRSQLSDALENRGGNIEIEGTTYKVTSSAWGNLVKESKRNLMPSISHKIYPKRYTVGYWEESMGWKKYRVYDEWENEYIGKILNKISAMYSAYKYNKTDTEYQKLLLEAKRKYE